MRKRLEKMILEALWRLFSIFLELSAKGKFVKNTPLC